VRWFTEGGRRIGVAFLSHNYLRRVPPATVDALVAELAGADRSIVVTHQLDAALAARLRDRVDLILAGHTHGGQVNPVLGWRHVSLARVETPYVDGRYRLGTTTVIVTAGIGYSIVPFRYASPGSIEVIEL
jgi:predicted MPP superfamily phosphohydrolase